MNNIFKLVSNYFRMFFAKIFKNSKRKLATYTIAIIVLIVGLVFSFIFTLLTYYNISNAIKLEVPEIAIYSFATTMIMFAFVLIITESGNNMKATDEELLLSLPINKRDIVISKILYYLLFDFLLVLIVLFPSYILYYVMVKGTSFIFVLRGLLQLIALTLFASGISGILSCLLILATKKFKYSKVIQTVFNMALIITFAIVYLGFMLVSQNVSYASKIYDLAIMQFFKNFMLYGGITNYLIICIIPIVLFSISVIIRSKSLGKNITTYHSKKIECNYTPSKVSKDLFVKELNNYMSIPIYVTNTIMGPILTLMLAIVILISGKNSFISMIEAIIASGYEGPMPSGIMPVVIKNFDVTIIFVMFLMQVLAPTTASSISIEGKKIWILKAHPISYKDVFKAKIKVNFMVNLFPAVLTSIFLSLALKNFWYIPLLLAISLLLVLLSSIIGLIANLLFPKLSWESEVEPVKQGISVLLTMGIDFCLIAIPLLFYFVLNITNTYLFFGIIILIYTLCVLILSKLLYTKGVKLYNEI